jgi:hypothetical protein
VLYAYETGVLLVVLLLWCARELWRAHLWRQVLRRLDELIDSLEHDSGPTTDDE